MHALNFNLSKLSKKNSITLHINKKNKYIKSIKILKTACSLTIKSSGFFFSSDGRGRQRGSVALSITISKQVGRLSEEIIAILTKEIFSEG